MLLKDLNISVSTGVNSCTFTGYYLTLQLWGEVSPDLSHFHFQNISKYCKMNPVSSQKLMHSVD